MVAQTAARLHRSILYHQSLRHMTQRQVLDHPLQTSWEEEEPLRVPSYQMQNSHPCRTHMRMSRRQPWTLHQHRCLQHLGDHHVPAVALVKCTFVHRRWKHPHLLWIRHLLWTLSPHHRLM